MEVSVTELLDYHIAKLPDNHLKKRQVLAMDSDQYKQLCAELKREVKKYRGYRVLKVVDDGES
jgi:hypothetical protein